MSTRSEVKQWSEALVASRPCPACGSIRLRLLDEPARDFVCDSCAEFFELKSSTSSLTSSVAAGNATVYQDRFTTEPPNLLLLTYRKDDAGKSPLSLSVVPRTLVGPDLVMPHRPSTQRSGRVVSMCSLRLAAIPPLARVPLLAAGLEVLPESCSMALSRWYALPARSSSVWHRDVLQMIGWLNKPVFSRKELAVFEPWLRARHPASATPLQTMSRVLQELKAAGLLEFSPESRGVYALTSEPVR